MTDQIANHRAFLAFISGILGDGFEVQHLYVELKHFRQGAGSVAPKLNARVRAADVVVFFFDAECRTQEDLEQARRTASGLVNALADRWPFCCGFALNPMSESAYLLFDPALEVVRRHHPKVDVRTLQRAKRRGQLVNKEALHRALNLDAHKRTFDREIALAYRAGEPWSCADPGYCAVVNGIRAVLARATE